MSSDALPGVNRPCHFEIHSPDPAVTIPFYEKVFGWKVHKWEGPREYWLLSTGDCCGLDGPGINGGLIRSRDGQPRTVNTVKVANVDAAAEAVTRAGGKIVVPKMAIPGVGWLVYCTDPGGAIFGLMHDDKNAK
jgi:predicted enzyme related to lactoylglutathione lyase